MVISALGTLLKQYTSFHPTLLNIEVYNFWRRNSSLNTNKEEGKLQQEMLIEVIQKNPGLLIQQADDLIGVLDTYALFVMQKVGKKYR